MVSERGRPRGFDIDFALDCAVDVFWKHGFQGASLQDLTKAMGLNKPSLYAAFGDKRSLYLKALERYIELRISQHGKVLMDEANGRYAVELFLNSMAEMLTNHNLPRGCFIINGTTGFGGASLPSEVEAALQNALQNSENLLNKRLLQAQNDGDLPEKTNIEALSSVFFTLIAGLAIQAKTGASTLKLKQIISEAMHLWP